VKVLYLCADTGIDVLGHKGASIHVREMIAAFARTGCDVELVAPRLVRVGADPASTDATVTRIRVPDEVQAVKQQLDEWTSAIAPGSSLPKDIRRVLYDRHLVDALRAYEACPPDLVYARASLLSTAGIELATRTGRPLVVELNAPLADEQLRYRQGALGATYERAERELVTRASLVVVVSEALAEHARRLGARAEAIRVLPNGVDPTRFRPVPVGVERRRRDGTALIGFVGALRPWHGVELLPELLHRVRLRHPGARLVIAGDGPLRDEIERRAIRWGVADATTMLGSVDHDDVPDVIRRFDIAAAPYPRLAHDFYFSPLKMFEYLACGVPVVASALGQIRDVVTDGVHARLVAPGDVAAAADACAQLLDDPVGAGTIARAGASLVHEGYTWDRNAAAVLDAVDALRSSR
jgi:glycosyltransferase involved in cell wall biosynthesis